MTHWLSLAVFFLFGCVVTLAAADPSPFTGSWDASKSAASVFSLDLTQRGQHLSGYHSAVARGGKRVDAVLPADDGPSITGIVSGRVAHVHFQSGYAADSRGEALLTLRHDGALAWKVTKSMGTFYLPVKATLRRQVRTPVPDRTLQRTASGHAVPSGSR